MTATGSRTIGRLDEAERRLNVVSRLEGLCRPLGRSVLISGAVAAETVMPLVPLGEHVLRGIAAPCAIFTLPDR